MAPAGRPDTEEVPTKWNGRPQRTASRVASPFGHAIIGTADYDDVVRRRLAARRTHPRRAAPRRRRSPRRASLR